MSSRETTRIGLFILLAASLLAATAHATNGMRMIGFGPVQSSMGGVSVGLPMDSAVVISNPAGMSALPGRVDFGASFFSPSVSYRATEIPLPTMFQGMLVERQGAQLSSDRGPSPVPAFGLIIPVNDRLRFGIGAYGVAGMGVDYAQNLYGGPTSSSYSQMRFAPAVSYKFSDLLSVGVSVNVMYAQMDFNAAQGFGQVAHLGGTAFGVGGTIGLYLQPHKMLSIGVAYETRSYFQAFRFNTPRHTMQNPATGASVTVPPGVDELNFDQPQAATLGFGFRPVPALHLGLDVQWLNWSGTNGLNQPGWSGANPDGSSKVGSMGWSLRWQDQVVMKLGAQYDINPMFSVRAGYNYGASPLNAGRAFENIAFPAIAEHHVTLGLGVNVGKHFVLNVGGTYSPEAKLTGSNPGNPLAQQGQGIASYETTMSQFSIELGLGYRF